MIESTNFRRIIRVLVGATMGDKIIWENMMLNIHETTWHGKKIIIDGPQDEPPMIMIDGSVVQIRFEGIESLRTYIDEQYKRLKKYRYSDENKRALNAIEKKANEQQLENDETFNIKAAELLKLED